MYQPPSDLDPTASALIEHKVRRLVAVGAICECDAADFGQDLALHAHVASPRFDPLLGNPDGFYRTIIARKALDLLKRDAAERRGRGHHVPLDDDTVDSRSDKQRDLKLDISTALSSAPPDLRRFATKLTEMSVAEAGRELGLTRGQARHRRMQLARYFTAWGLAPKSPTRTTNSRGDSVLDKYQRRVATAEEGAS